MQEVILQAGDISKRPEGALESNGNFCTHQKWFHKHVPLDKDIPAVMARRTLGVYCKRWCGRRQSFPGFATVYMLNEQSMLICCLRYTLHRAKAQHLLETAPLWDAIRQDTLSLAQQPFTCRQCEVQPTQARTCCHSGTHGRGDLPPSAS